MLAFLVIHKEGDSSLNSSVGCGGRQLRLELAVNDFERFLTADKGVSVTTRECYVRHVLPFLTEVGGRPAWLISTACRLSGCVRM
jgi:hypothetical protein